MNFKQKIYLSIFFITVAFLLLLVLCVLPTLRSIVKASNDLSARRQELASIEYLGQNFQDVEERFHSYERSLEDMDDLLKRESLIDPEIPVSFINFFREQADELNLALSISPLEFHQQENEGWDYMDFRVSGVGRFIDMMKFFKKMKNSRWLIEEESLSISKQEDINVELGGLSSGDYININLLIKVYAQE